MEPILLGAYLMALIVIVVVMLTVAVIWAPFIPPRWRRDLVVAFASLGGAIGTLFSAEMRGRYTAQFYLHPALYLLSIALIGVTFYAIFHLVYEIYYRRNRTVAIAGAVIFVMVVALIGLNFALWSANGYGDEERYPWTVYVAIECAYGLGAAAYLLFAHGSFSRAKRLSDSGRGDPEFIAGLKLAAIFAILIGCALAFVALGAFFVDLSQPVWLGTSLFWLGWVVLVAILFLIIVKRAIGMMGGGRPQ